MLYDKIELETGETVLKTVRKHWFVITVEMLAIILMGLLPVFGCFILLYLPYNAATTVLFEDNLPLLLFGLTGWLLLSVLATIVAWTHYFLDLWIITDRRIIVIEQISFFNRKVSNFRLERMQDIKVTISGIIPTLLNYGTVRAQTASAAESNFTSPALPDPRGLQSLIQTAMDARLKALGDTPIMAD
jgi:Bacterial PH domain